MTLIEALGAFGVGLAVGNQLTYWLSTKPWIDRIARMRYHGFRPDEPVPARPKTVPFPETNET